MNVFSRKSKEPELIQSISYPYKAHGTRGIAAAKPASGRNFGKHFVLLFVFGAFGFLILSGFSKSASQTLGVTTQDTVEARAPEPEPVTPLDHSQMATQINEIIAANPGMDIGVSWVDLTSGDVGNYGVQDPFVAASTAKLLTAIAYLHDVENGKNTLSEPVGSRTAQEALEAMIVDSDNEAWHDFNNSVMSHGELTEYANAIGFSGYDADDNTVTPQSLARLVGNLYKKRLLDDTHTNLLLSYMERATEVPYFKDAAPNGVTIYHKPGYLTDRIHDAAVIDDGNRPYVLVLFTKSRSGDYNTAIGATIFESIATATLDSFIRIPNQLR